MTRACNIKGWATSICSPKKGTSAGGGGKAAASLSLRSRGLSRRWQSANEASDRDAGGGNWRPSPRVLSAAAAKRRPRRAVCVLCVCVCVTLSQKKVKIIIYYENSLHVRIAHWVVRTTFEFIKAYFRFLQYLRVVFLVYIILRQRFHHKIKSSCG